MWVKFVPRYKKNSAPPPTILEPAIAACTAAHAAGLEVHIGHGIDYQIAPHFKLLPHVSEADIGHAIIAEALFCGLRQQCDACASCLTNMLMPHKKKLWKKELSRTELAHSCAWVGKELQHSKPFCLWLQGEVGAGKTSWVVEFFYYLGLARHIAVTSPTFTYARAYDIGGKLYNHCDCIA